MAATSKMAQKVKETNTSYILIQEPYKDNDNQLKFLPKNWQIWTSTNAKAAIVSTNICNKPMSLFQGCNVVAIKIHLDNTPCVLLTAYCAPTANLDATLLEIGQAVDEGNGLPILIGADLNSRGRNWGYPDTNNRGKTLLDFMASRNLLLHNKQNSPPTFEHSTGKGWPDVTMSSTHRPFSNIQWKVDTEEVSLSGHKYVWIKLKGDVTTMKFIRFKTKFGDHKKFKSRATKTLKRLDEDLNSCTDSAQLDLISTNFARNVIKDCSDVYKKTSTKEKVQLSWWTPDLEIQKKKIRAIRKRTQRATELTQPFWKLRLSKEIAAYKKAINTQRLVSWKKFCSSSVKAFDKPYKISCKKPTYPVNIIMTNLSITQGSYEDNAKQLLEQMYGSSGVTIPRSPVMTSPPFIFHPRQTRTDKDFSTSEILAVAKTFPPDKAPGYDGIDYRIIKRLLEINPEPFTKLFNRCLHLGHFPSPWKIGILLLFLKPNKDPQQLDSYRPIILLPTIGKFMEKLMTQRLSYHLNKHGYLSHHQYGFREGKSTEEAIHNLINILTEERNKSKHVAMISLDIKGAFDSIRHEDINHSLQRSPCPLNISVLFQDLLDNRLILLPTPSGPVSHPQKKGTPQGSCSGPALWNLLFDGVLRLHFEQDTHIQAFADDLVLLVSHSTRDGLGIKATKELQKVDNWLQGHGLSLSPGKTQYTLFSSLQSSPSIKLQGKTIPKRSAIKYLGIWIDEVLKWDIHVQHVRTKTSRLLQDLKRIAGPAWGMQQRFKNLHYRMVAERIAAYGVAIWHSNPTVTQRTTLNSIQRPFLLHTTGAYHTTPTLALQIATCNPPLSVTLQAEAALTRATRLNEDLSFGSIQVSSRDIEKNIYGWTDHPASALADDRVQIQDDQQHDISVMEVQIFTDGSKMTTGVGAAFCVIFRNFIYHEKKIKLNDTASIFQAEAIAIREAIHWASTISERTRIYSDSQATLKAVKLVKHRNNIIRDIQLGLETNKHINLSWTRAHVGTIGNEHADKLAKEAAEDPNLATLQTPIPISRLKFLIRKEIERMWQHSWDEGTTGRLLHQIHRSVPNSRSLKPWHRFIIQFLTEHGPFPTYLHRFRLRRTDTCGCGQVGTPTHYLTTCPLTSSFHLATPGPEFLLEWKKAILFTCSTRNRVISMMQFLTENRDLIFPEEPPVQLQGRSCGRRRRSQRLRSHATQ